jgi:hypothetical protein
MRAKLGLLLLAVATLVAGCGESGRSRLGSPSTTGAPPAADQCFGPAIADAPPYIPGKYRFVRRIVGGDTGNFPGYSDQITWIYNLSCAGDDAPYPLMISRVSDPKAVISATGGHDGEVLTGMAVGRTGIYHDGWTALASPINSPGQKAELKWDTAVVNSVTLRWAQGTYGLRGAKTRGVTREESIKMALALRI